MNNDDYVFQTVWFGLHTWAAAAYVAIALMFAIGAVLHAGSAAHHREKMKLAYRPTWRDFLGVT